MPKQTWFTITNKAPDTLEIDLMDEIGAYGVSAKQFVAQLSLAKGVAKKLKLNIDCPGGSCDQGFTMHDALIASGLEITANVIGMAASMASVVMLAAKTITIAENGRVMIHRVSGGAMGNPDDMDAAAKRMRQYEDRIVSLYTGRTGKSDTQIRDMMKADMGTWLFGQDAVDAGFADSVTKGTKAKAFTMAWARHFTVLPSALFDIPTNPESKPPTPPHATMTPEEIKAAADKKAAEDKIAADKVIADKALADKAEADAKIITDLQSRIDKMEAEAKVVTDAKAAADKLKAEADAKAKDPAVLIARIETLEALLKAGVLGATHSGKAIEGADGGGDSKEDPRAKALERLTAKNKTLVG